MWVFIILDFHILVFVSFVLLNLECCLRISESVLLCSLPARETHVQNSGLYFQVLLMYVMCVFVYLYVLLCILLVFRYFQVVFLLWSLLQAFVLPKGRFFFSHVQIEQKTWYVLLSSFISLVVFQ